MSIYSDNGFVRPSQYHLNSKGIITNDLSMKGADGEFLHICGDNDWAFLALDLLEPIMNEAKKITKLVQDRKTQTPIIKAVILGKNDKRIMDVYFGGKGKCEKILGLPIIATDKLDEVTFLVEDTNSIPF